MVVFTRKIFDGLVTGTTSVFTDVESSELLGSVERLSFTLGTFGVQGSAPTIDAQLEHSMDRVHWVNQQPSPELSAGLLLDNVMTFINVSTTVLNFVRLRIALGGTSPSGIVVVWAIGRTPAGS